ncbi:MAG: glycosyltransferase family 4 protein [Nitrospiraceae bacterium]
MNTNSITLVHITTVPQSLAFMTGQVGYMKSRGFEIVGLSSPGALLTSFAEREGVPVHAVEMPRRITPWRDILALIKLVLVLRRIRPQIVHAHTPKGGLLGMLSAWIVRTPVRIYHMRGLPFTTAIGWRRRLLMWSERISCGLADQVLCVSSSVRQLAIDSRLCRPEKIAVLARGSGNGVDAAQTFNDSNISPALREETRRRCNIPPDALVLGFIGRIVRDKGIIELAGAWKELREEFPDLHLLLVGPHEPQDPIPAEIDRMLHSDPRVHLLGEVSNTPPLYAVMDVLALPTYREGFPNVLLEAAGMKVPVVATCVPGCADAVQDGVTGMLVPPCDAARLGGALRTYLHDGGLRHRHGAAARDWVLQEFRPERIWQAIYEEYLELLEKKGIPAPDAGIAATLGDFSKNVGRAERRLVKTLS